MSETYTAQYPMLFSLVIASHCFHYQLHFHQMNLCNLFPTQEYFTRIK